MNFLALLGWSPGEDRERMTLAEMTALFALERIGPSPSRFDHEKLLWMNGQYLQETPDARLLELLAPFGLPARDAGDAREGHRAPAPAREDARRARAGRSPSTATIPPRSTRPA